MREHQAAEARRSPRSWPKRLGKLLLVGLASLILLEVGLRVRQWAKYGTPFSLVALERHESGLMIPSPGSHRGPVHINSRGFRGPELRAGPREGRVRLAVLGGSTSFCAQVTSEELAWPALVTAELTRRHPEHAFDHVNGGVPGYTTRQSLINLRERVAALEPDVIVVYHATNDLVHESRVLAEQRGYESVQHGRVGSTPWLTWNVLYKNYRGLVGRGATATELVELDAEELGAPFRGNLRALLAAARESAPLVAVATFSTRMRRGQAQAELVQATASARFYMPYMSVEALLDGYEDYNRIVREEAERGGALLIAGEETVPGDALHFTDSVHFTDEGSRRMAARVVEALEASPAFGELLRSKRATRPGS